MMQISPRQPGNGSGWLRSGFTIIELLIVVAILLLLTTFTAVAIDFSFQSERVGAASRQVQSMLEGARDRAIRTGAPVGVRFLLDQDPDNGRLVSSMVYVSLADEWTTGHITLKRPDFNDDGVVDDLDGDGDPDDRVLMVDGDAQTRWLSLYHRGFLGVYERDANNNGVLDANEDSNGNGVFDRVTPRIKIPGNRNGTWYRVSTFWLGRSTTTPNRLQLVQDYRDPGTTPRDEVVAFEGTGNSTYILELPPRVMPDADPVTFSDGVVIDLDASSVPITWRPPSGVSSISTAADAYAQHRFPYSNRMDLMFSPRGTIIGDAAGLGVLHFYIALREDVQRAIDTDVSGGRASPAIGNFQPGRRRTINGAAAPVIPSDLFFDEDRNSNGTLDSGEDLNGNGILDAEPAGDRALVSVFASTGKVSAYPLNLIDQSEDLNGNGSFDPGEIDYNGNGALDGPDGFLDDPFVYAELGEASGQ